jgi:hypothetical protein
LPRIGHLRVCDIDFAVIQDLTLALKESRNLVCTRKPRKTHPNTVNKVLGCLKHKPCSIEAQRSRRGAGALDPGYLHYLRPQPLRHGDPSAPMMRSPLREPGMSQGQSRSSAHA